MTLRYFCGEDRRRSEIAARADLNAVDFLEVLDAPGQAPKDRQRTLFIHFVHDPTGLGLAPENVVIEGGERIRAIRVVTAQTGVDQRSGSAVPVLIVEVDRPGDFSTYTLRLIPTAGNPLTALDQLLRAVDFSFKVACGTKFDPLRERHCPPGAHAEPTLDYLARDYLTLRQLILDRLAVLIPDWQERNPADLGMVLAELMAYLGDQLSYRQDAVATEGYLGTCRLRTSARRHARLVDYLMHDGCNARVWVQVRLEPGTPPFELPDAVFYSTLPGLPVRIRPQSAEHDRAKAAQLVTFRSLGPARLAPEHNEIRFYTWGGRQCCLPTGATSASLRGPLPNLEPGMVLVLTEARSPRTGDSDGADLAHRHPVRITEMTHTADPVGGRFDRVPTDTPVPVTEISWGNDDALPFPLCISAETEEQFGGAFVDDVSVALGNIVLADHGAPAEEELGVAPTDTMLQVLADPPDDPGPDAGGPPARTVLTPARFRPVLGGGPLTQAVPYDPASPPGSARDALRFDPSAALPDISLHDGTSHPWEPRIDLLSSTAVDRHFVVEVEADGRVRVRFGDGVLGERPTAGRTFTARYRIGNGRAGNVGAGTLRHVVTSADGISAVANPIAASGGVDMETIDEVRQHAPVAFRPQTLPGEPGRPDGRTLSRAVTPADYAAVTETHPAIQRAAATFRWTGSWRTVSVTVDPFGGAAVTAAFEDSLLRYLGRYRLAGHDLEITPPRLVALEITVHVQVRPGYFAAHVRRELLDAFSNRVLPDGRRGVFHPDNLTFGQTIYLSPLYAAAHSVDGVQAVDITTFQRLDQPGPAALAAGRLALDRLEIARLDNDPNFPEHGVLTLSVEETR